MYRIMSLPAGKTPFIQFDASDSSSITKSGTSLTAWTNKGSAGGSTTTTRGAVTTGTSSYNSKNLISFPSSSIVEIPNIKLPSQAVYAFIVTKITSITDYVGFFNNYSNGGAMILGQFTGSYLIWGGPNAVRLNVLASVSNFTSTTKPRIITWCNSSVSTANNVIKLNGTSFGLSTNSSESGVGGYNTSEFRTYVMNLYSGSQEMGEMIIFGTNLTSTEINNTEGYLAWKWGIQGDLNVAHPYYPVKVSVNAPSFAGGAVSLSWTAGIYTSFNVYRDTQASGATKSLITTTASTSYSDSSVSTGQTYYYFVEGAIQGTYSGLMSNAQSVTTNSAPSQPAAPTITSVGNQTITIGWVAPANGGSAITGYTIKIYNETASTSSTTSAATEDTSIVISSLINGNSYTFTIVATNAIGSSSESSKSAESVPGLIPAQPAAPSITSVGNGTVTIGWVAPASVPAISGYTITIYNLTASTSSMTSAAAGETSKVISSLSNDTSYSFTLIATNSIGPSIESVASAIAIPYTIPGAPTGVSAIPESLCALVSWTKPANNGSRITSYTITALQSNNPVITVVINGEDNTGGYVYGLSNGTAYTFTVKATNLAGDSSSSLASSPVTPVSNAPTTAVTTAISTGNTDIITNYINDTVVTTPEETADLSIEMRTSLNAGTTGATNEQKADTKLAYIDGMRAKVGADNFTIPSDKFTDFIRTLQTVTSEPLTPKPIVTFLPEYTASTATVDVSAISVLNYLQLEVPIGYTILLQNGEISISLTYNGTNYSDGTNIYTAGSAIILGSKTFILVGIGSGTFNVLNTEQIICITKGSMIQTPSGEVPVETLHTGDAVLTSDERTVQITKFKQIVVVAANENNAPYVIEKNAFGPGVPPNRLVVSPRHAIQLPSGLWEIPREAAKVNSKVYQKTDAIGKQVVYYHYSLLNYATDTTIVNGQALECLNDGDFKESYVWNEAKQGYVRTLNSFHKNGKHILKN